MKVIGLTGGVGSGKSLAAKILAQECGATLLITDELGHKVMEPGQKGYDSVVKHFGTDILLPDETIDRKALAEIVFQNEEERKALNDMIHPLVMQYIREFIEGRRREQGVIVLESALLFESGCDAFCDSVWYIRVSKQKRIWRLKQNRHYSEEKIAGIMAKQMEETEFVQKCDVIIENNETPEQLQDEIRQKISQADFII
jgi:dephospho-CoA kinase